MAIVCVVFALGGCTTTGRNAQIDRALEDYYLGNYSSAKTQLQPFADKLSPDYVLNNLRYGSAALSDYDLDRAETAFYRAYEVMNAGKVNDAGRATAAVVVHEGFKVWKGEPFERAMANFYLGLVYYMRQDYDNARAAFENALFKLRDYGEGDDKTDEYREYESDFTIAYVMLARTWLRLDEPEKARDMLERVRQIRPDVAPLADVDLHERSNVLLVVDVGYGPRKVTQYDNSIVTFSPKPSQVGPVPLPTVLVDGQMVPSSLGAPAVDLIALSDDRRWQSIDTIRLAKSAIGTGLMGVGAYQGMKRKPDYGSAAALIAAGALLKASSGADLRHWETLPRTTFLIPLRLPPGRHDVTIRLGGPYGLSQTWQGILAPEQADSAYYIRLSRNSSGTYRWPPAGLRAQPDQVISSSH